MVDENKKKEIAVIGNDEFTLGFELVGIQESYGKKNYREDIKELINREDLGIVIAEETDIEELPGRLQNQVQNSVDPVVVALSEDAEDENLQEQIRQVIGADIT
ncbi:MAG: V-type ATP synthase subunit F [Nanohaloarchaea archaeon QH_8_44_6]|nr:MAG: V-type ATP synthase subunit F [Nanohaloarchaea archaeon QH_8_44_6]